MKKKKTNPDVVHLEQPKFYLVQVDNRGVMVRIKPLNKGHYDLRVDSNGSFDIGTFIDMDLDFTRKVHAHFYPTIKLEDHGQS